MAQVDVLQGTEDSLLHSDTSFEEMGMSALFLVLQAHADAIVCAGESLLIVVSSLSTLLSLFSHFLPTRSPEHYLRALREMHIRKPSRIQGAALPVLLSNPSVPL